MTLSNRPIVSKEQLDNIENGENATCYICGDKLDVGGAIDNYYPYFEEYNRCEKHLHKLDERQEALNKKYKR